MKKQIFISIFLSILLNSSFAQNWLWANSGGSILPNNQGVSMCRDANGNIYVLGDIQGSLPFNYNNNYAVFNSDTLIINGVNDIFVAKYDSVGNQLWVRNFGGNYDNWNEQKTEIPIKIAYNHYNNSVYITGAFVGSCSFDAHTIYASGQDDSNIFLAKFDTGGNCVWAKSAGSSGNDIGMGLGFLSSGNVLLTGRTRYNAVFDTISMSNGGFLAMYDDDGNCKWVKNIFKGLDHFPYGATGEIMSLKIYDDDVFILGRKLTNYDSIYVDTILFTGLTDSYYNILARLDSMGNVKWAKLIGGPGATTRPTLSVDSNGNCYFGNRFWGEYAIFETDTILSQDTANFFFAKYDKNGNRLWLRQASATISGNIQGSYSDLNGNVYFAGGELAGSATFDSTTINANSARDMFIVRYNSNGDFQGVIHAGPATAYDILADDNGACIATGNFGLEQPGQWSLQLGSTTLLTHGYQDFFIAKIDAIITELYEPKIALNNQLLIYANPSAGKCNVIIPEEFYYEQQLIMNIYDLNGKLLEETLLEINDNTIKLDLEHEASGVYIITLSNGKKVYTGKMIFE